MIEMLAPTRMKGLAAAVCVVCAVLATGCQKAARTDATQALAKSFQAAEPEARQAIQRVNTSLNAGNITEATRTLAPVIEGRNLTQAQKEAVGVALQQINKAIAANPALDTKEMYELRAKMFHTVHSGPGF